MDGNKMSENSVRILLVEDEDGDARLVEEMLRECGGFRIASRADCLAGALEAAGEGKTDLVLLDLTLPDSSSGFDAFAQVAARAGGVPVIVLSGSDDQETALRAVHEGAQDYLVKGRFEAELLLRAIRCALGRSRPGSAFLRERDFFHALIDYLPDRVCFKDAQCRYIRVNPALARCLKIGNCEEAIGKCDADFFPPERAQAAREDDLRILQTGEAILGKIEEEPLPDGAAGWLLVSKLPLRDRHGRILGLAGISRDITEEKRAREQLIEANAELSAALDDLQKTTERLRHVQLELIESEKLKTVGRLAAGVAHEVKNPLAVISMGVEYLSSLPTSEDAGVPLVLTEMSDAVKRADNVIRGLLDFSAPRRMELKPENLNAVVDRALVLVRGDMKGVRIVEELQPGLPPLRIDRSRIEQVLINIFTNSCHAMPRGGTLTVRTSARRISAEEEHSAGAGPQPFRAGDTVVLLETEDTGSGIPEDKLAKIFDPFFTTKPSGTGTGLGLTVTRSIIDLHGGTITIGNRPEGGARVAITFKAD